LWELVVTRVVINISPFLPPQNSGVGDYAVNVGQRIAGVSGAPCAFISAGHALSDQPGNSPTVRNISGQASSTKFWRAVAELAKTAPTANTQLGSPDSFEATAPSDSHRVAIVLNYSGYGYDRNGCAAWLAEALRERPPEVDCVATYFHELYATGKPWRRAYWYSAKQRRIAIEIARLSDVLLTNCAHHGKWLEESTCRPAGSVACLPVPSNVGEPLSVPDIGTRPLRAVLFGNAKRKQFALTENAELVAAGLRHLQISELIDIGENCQIDRAAFDRAGVGIVQRGYLSAAEVSAELLNCRVGLLRYNTKFLAKSGTYAAFVAHGVVPVVSCAADSPVRSFPYLTFDELQTSSWPAIERLSQEVIELYPGFSVQSHAEAFVDAFAGIAVR
jgi:hypothetical protein